MRMGQTADLTLASVDLLRNVSQCDNCGQRRPLTFGRDAIHVETCFIELVAQVDDFFFEFAVPLLCSVCDLLGLLLVASQLVDGPLEVVNVVLRPLSDGALGFSVVGSLSLELRGGQRSYASSASSRGALLGGAR